MGKVQTYERFSNSDIESTVTHILGAESAVRVKQKRAMEYSRDVLKAMVRGDCHPKSAAHSLLRLWRKTGLTR